MDLRVGIVPVAADPQDQQGCGSAPVVSLCTLSPLYDGQTMPLLDQHLDTTVRCGAQSGLSGRGEATLALREGFHAEHESSDDSSAVLLIGASTDITLHLIDRMPRGPDQKKHAILCRLPL